MSLDGAEGSEKLSEFLDRELRRDLRNLLLHVWLESYRFHYQKDSIDDGEQLGAHLLQYFVERHYLTIEDLPEYVRAGQETNAGHPQYLLKLVRRMIASRMGVNPKDKIPASLNFMAHPLALKKSLNGFLPSTAFFKKHHQRHVGRGSRTWKRRTHRGTYGCAI